MEQEQEETLSKQAVMRAQKYEKGKINVSNMDAIIQRALSRKKDRDVR